MTSLISAIFKHVQLTGHVDTLFPQQSLLGEGGRPSKMCTHIYTLYTYIHLIIIIFTIHSLALKFTDLSVSREIEAVRRTQMVRWRSVMGWRGGEWFYSPHVRHSDEEQSDTHDRSSNRGGLSMAIHSQGRVMTHTVVHLRGIKI